MNEWVVDRILARPGHGLEAEDIRILRRMADYFDRASLKIVWDDGASGTALTVHLSNDVERFRLTMVDLRTWYDHLRSGRPLDWSALPRVERAARNDDGRPEGRPSGELS